MSPARCRSSAVKPGSCVAARTRALRRVRGVWNARRCGPFTLGRSRRPRRLEAAAAPPPVLQRHLWWPAAPFGLSTASAVAYNSNRLPATLVQCCHGLTRRRSAAARRAPVLPACRCAAQWLLARPHADQSLLDFKFSYFIRACNIMGLKWQESLAWEGCLACALAAVPSLRPPRHRHPLGLWRPARSAS